MLFAKIHSLICIAAVFTAIAGPSVSLAAGSTIFDGVRAELPDASNGWERQESRSGILLRKHFPSDPNSRRNRPAAALIQIFEPLPSTPGGLAANFGHIVSGLPELAEKRPRRVSGVTSNGHPIIVERRCCARRDGVSIEAIHVGIEGPAGQIFWGLFTLGGNREQKAQAEADFEAMVRSLLLSPADKPFQLAVPKDGGGLEGAYTHLDTGLRPNVFGGMDFYSKSKIMLFDRSGLYSRRIPRGNGDIEAHCKAQPTDCGTYRLTGGSTTIEMTKVMGGFRVLATDAKPLERLGKNLKIGKAKYRPISPLPRGTRFDGVWRYSYASSGSGAFSSGSVSGQRTLKLTPEGKFNRTGWAGATSSNESADSRTSVSTSSGRQVDSGRYEVDGFRLVLTGEDGRSETYSIFRPDGESDGLLIINGANYLKRKSSEKR